MQKLKFVLLSLILAVAVAACGDDDEDNNGTTNNGTVDAGDTGGSDASDAGVACDSAEEPTCCNASFEVVDATCNEDTTEWECPSGSTSLPVGGVCEETDAGNTDTGDTGGDTADAGA